MVRESIYIRELIEKEQKINERKNKNSDILVYIENFIIFFNGHPIILLIVIGVLYWGLICLILILRGESIFVSSFVFVAYMTSFIAFWGMAINIEKKYNDEIAECKNLSQNIEKKYSSLKSYCKQLKTLYDKKLKENFINCAEYIADLKTLEYDLSVKYLISKKRPAHSEAKRIEKLRKQTKECIVQYKLMKYEYEYLFSVFPELENYIESSNKEDNIKELKDNYDYVRVWVTKEEYEKLSENDRNQLALERYINSRKKNKWQIGRDYEMYIGHTYEEKGYKVQYTGIAKRMEDMGRDLIAIKDNTVLIVQCKYWSKNKTIHENHICQLFGTTIQYNIENNCKAKPVFVTSASLSDTALKFAQYLDIEVVQNKEFQEFPRIKCNIGKDDEKIYHLPFDQQYDRTVIGDKQGECFAWNTTEAALKGFRRAKKYFYKRI